MKEVKKIKANNGSIVATIIICAVLLAGAGYLMVPAVPTASDIALAVDVPTAAEVAALITVPAAPAAAEVNTVKTDQIWELIFGSCEDEISNKAETHVINKVSNNLDDLTDFIEDNVVDFDKITNGPTLDNDETEVEVTEIGYCVVGTVEIGDDEDDKSAIVTLIYDFKYEDDSDSTKQKGSVTVTGVVDYDEGIWADRDVELSYALN